MQMASISAMKVVPRMKPSMDWKPRRAIRSSWGAEVPGAQSCRERTALSESRRKKNVSSRASTAAARNWPTTLTPGQQSGGRGAAELAQQLLGVGGEIVQ